MTPGAQHPPLLTRGPADPYWPYVASLLKFEGADNSTAITDLAGLVWTNADSNTYLGQPIKSFNGSGGNVYSVPDFAQSNVSLAGAPGQSYAWLRRTNGGTSYLEYTHLTTGAVSISLTYGNDPLAAGVISIFCDDGGNLYTFNASYVPSRIWHVNVSTGIPRYIDLNTQIQTVPPYPTVTSISFGAARDPTALYVQTDLGAYYIDPLNWNAPGHSCGQIPLGVSFTRFLRYPMSIPGRLYGIIGGTIQFVDITSGPIYSAPTNLGIAASGSNYPTLGLGPSLYTVSGSTISSWDTLTGAFINSVTPVCDPEHGSASELIPYYSDSASYLWARFYSGGSDASEWLKLNMATFTVAGRMPASNYFEIIGEPASSGPAFFAIDPLVTGGAVATTRFGANCIDTDEKLYGASSGLFMGGGGITTPAATAWNWGTGDFTIEFSVRFLPRVIGFAQEISSNILGAEQTPAGALNPSIRIFVNAGVEVYFYCMDSSYNILAPLTFAAPLANTWYSFAYQRSGTTFSLYANGTLQSTASSAAAVASPTAPMAIGRVGNRAAAAYPYQNASFMNIDEFRLTKGLARYSGAYTPAAFPTHG